MKNHRAAAIGAIAAFALAGSGAFAADTPAPAAPAAALPSLAGTYRCESEQNFCDMGKTFTITQDGAVLSIQNEKGVSGHASVTNDVMINVHGPWNTIGVVRGANKNMISLSNGTRWVKM